MFHLVEQWSFYGTKDQGESDVSGLLLFGE